MSAKGGLASAHTEIRVGSIASAISLTTDTSIIEANALMSTALATQIKVVREIIGIYDERIKSLFETLPDADLFKSLPGIGPAWDRACSRHCAITETDLIALKKFKTTLVLHL